MPSTAARARFSRVVLPSDSPDTDARALGRFGVRSPSNHGTSTTPPAPGSAERARAASSSCEAPRSRAVASSTRAALRVRSEEHTSELQSLMRISYAVFCLKKKKTQNQQQQTQNAQTNTTIKESE